MIASSATASPLPRLLLLFSFSTGIIDAVSVLGLGNVFTANMTGNVVFLGFALAGQGGFVPVLLISALLGFLAGAMIGGRLANAHRLAPLHTWLTRCAWVEALLIFAAAGTMLAFAGNTGQPLQVALIVMLGIAMGLRNATIRRLGVADLTTTVLTLTLTGIAADSGAAGGKNPNLLRRGGAVAAIFAGAFVGALLIGPFGGALPLAVAGLVTILAALAVRRHPALAAPPA